MRDDEWSIESDNDSIIIKGNEQTHKKLKVHILEHFGRLKCTDQELVHIPKLYNLTYLNCENNVIVFIPKLKNLIKLKCNSNRLHYLPEFPNLEILDCSYNKLVRIETQPNLLKLNCSHNKLTYLPKLPHIQSLSCNNNKIIRLQNLYNLTRLNISSNENISVAGLHASELKILKCNRMELDELNNLYESLTKLACTHNKLSDPTSISELPNLTNLNCSYNKFISLYDLPNGLIQLNCEGNRYLTRIPALWNLKVMKCANCDLNNLPTLPKLDHLDCSHNRLLRLKNDLNLKYLDCSYNKLTWLPETLVKSINRGIVTVYGNSFRKEFLDPKLEHSPLSLLEICASAVHRLKQLDQILITDIMEQINHMKKCLGCQNLTIQLYSYYRSNNDCTIKYRRCAQCSF